MACGLSRTSACLSAPGISKGVYILPVSVTTDHFMGKAVTFYHGEGNNMRCYCRAESLGEAYDMLDKNGVDAAILAGGTDLLVSIRAGKVSPPVIVDIAGIGELRGVERNDTQVVVGATTTMSDLVRSTLVKSSAGLLSMAADSVGSPQVRNRATVGGNICNASPAADVVTALLALEATAILGSSKGERRLPLESFLAGPGETARQPTEVLHAVCFQALESGDLYFFKKVGLRSALSISVVNLACLVRKGDSGNFKVRIAMGAVAPTCIRAREAEVLLENEGFSEETVREASRLAAASCDPISDIRASAEYRRHLVQVWVRRALEVFMSEGGLGDAI